MTPRQKLIKSRKPIRNLTVRRVGLLQLKSPIMVTHSWSSRLFWITSRLHARWIALLPRQGQTSLGSAWPDRCIIRRPAERRRPGNLAAHRVMIDRSRSALCPPGHWERRPECNRWWRVHNRGRGRDDGLDSANNRHAAIPSKAIPICSTPLIDRRRERFWLLAPSLLPPCRSQIRDRHGGHNRGSRPASFDNTHHPNAFL